MRSGRLALSLGLLLGSVPCLGQEIVSAGKGSYTASVPAGLGDGIGKVEKEPLHLVNDDGRPLPSNHWWTQLIVSRYAKSLWSYPLKVDTSEKGLQLFFPIRWAPSGNDPMCDYPLTVGGKDLKPEDSRAKSWSDWTVSFRMGESADKYMGVTLGEGMPCVWIEYHGTQPVLNFPPGARPEFFDLSGRKADLPLTGDCVGVRYQDRQFGLFAPDGSKFAFDGTTLGVEFSGKSQFLVVCPLPAEKDLAYFHKYAYAVPRDTRVSWHYDPAKGQVTTNWKITAEALKGTDTKVVQGWIPHHYRKTSNNLQFDGIDYISPRGKMRCAAGNGFEIGYAFDGIVPNLPAPAAIGGAHDYDPARMHEYLEDLARNPKTGADTYWGGKDILRLGQAALMAQQTKDATYPQFVDALRLAMENWFTYTPGEKDHYFVYYPHWKSLVGVRPSYGSEAFNDHHFHYGYFTFASALLAMHDPAFARDYGPMATLVAKDYANWDRNDKRFPFFRTFDLWAGHSWAGGTSSPGGENQESSSEAVQSWAGLVYLGQALQNPRMTDAGIMGYAMETRATLEYWFNEGGDVFPPEWKHSITGMVWSGGKVFGTYFTGDPAWVYGIQWLPASPMLSYLVGDPKFARQMFENMQRDFNAHEATEAAKKHRPVRPASIKTFESGLGSVMLGYVLMYDPNWTAAQLDELWNEPGDKIGHNASEMAVMYYQAHSMRSLGLVDWSCHGSSPTSMVYKNDQTGVSTYIVWNPTTQPQTVQFYKGDRAIGRLTAQPQALTSTHQLQPG